MAFDKVIDSAKLDGALSATADAIRSVKDSTDPIGWNEETGFADALSDISTGLPTQEKTIKITQNGTVEVTPDEGSALSKVTAEVDILTDIPDEIFVLTGDCSYRFTGNHDWEIEHFGDRFTSRDLVNTSYMFENSSLTELPFKLNYQLGSDGSKTIYFTFYKSKFTNLPDIDFKADGFSLSCHGLFQESSKLESIGVISNFKISNAGNMFNTCSRLRYLPVFENVSVREGTHEATDKTSGYMVSIFEDCYSLREIPESFLSQLYASTPNNNQSLYYSGFTNCYVLNELRRLAVMRGIPSSNHFQYTFNNCYRLKEIIFDTNEDGSPIIVRWKSQTIDTSSVGYVNTTSSNPYTICGYNSGITADKRVNDDTTYQALKDDPDWFATSVDYSRYNHDSAVNTINSLPDTSAYLAEKGGTNTIRFKGGAGALTDGGAINTLTEEEIAVATAKGWTVTFA